MAGAVTGPAPRQYAGLSQFAIPPALSPPRAKTGPSSLDSRKLTLPLSSPTLRAGSPEAHTYTHLAPDVVLTILPAAAQDVYYRDEIGNISTSHLLVLDDSVEMEIRPRFPLFGGWKTHYMVGYNLPSYEYLYNLGDQYALKMRLVDHVFDDQVIDSLTVKLILPEGARNIQVDTPYSIQRDPDDLHYTYLDTFGRPVVVAHKKNLVEQHIQDVVVHYNFNKILMLQEPLLVVGAFYILFFTVIVYVRLDFSITKDPAVEVRMKVASITEQVLTLVNKRLGLYRHFDEVINKYKQSRDMGALNSGRKTLEAEHRTLTNEVGEIQKLDGLVKDLVSRSCQEAERLVAGKVKKETYIESEKQLSAKRQDLVTRIDSLLDALNIQVDTPYSIQRDPDDLHYTYLDTFGRPVVVAHKKNLVEQHIQDVVVHYNFNKILMLQEPLLVVGAFYILFFTVIVYVRLDFSITKDPAVEVRMKVASITEQVLTLVNKRLGLYRHFDEVINKYKQSRDMGALNSGRKTLEAEHRTLTNEVASLQSRLKAEGSDLADKVRRLPGPRGGGNETHVPQHFHLFQVLLPA
ncbi:Dolichyl-diphosphooligosaccharide--protein glycosyltransferase subunit 1 [Acipenser ruthenus]|uniref:Dolichyl-diphosphooligosaccharide--protein glycosyltransferase subunit 1 n=1 Tax=Acipenser ruthenus TaxID=7906 RepID=A0A444UTG8_ACIRT|nr:Dolichyl-diphosphooligosaccharide--protein glycosyltransferase subunit 1 [Acipenser ruthenus]